MMRRLLVPVLFAVAAGAWAALLCPVPPPGRPALALHTRLEFAWANGPPDPDHPDQFVPPGADWDLARFLRDPQFLAELRREPAVAVAGLCDGVPDPPPPDWAASWVALERLPTRNSYTDLILRGDDPDRLRALRGPVLAALHRRLAGLDGQSVLLEGPDSWGPGGDADGPRRRLALSLGCLALAVLVVVRLTGEDRRPGPSKVPAMTAPSPAAPCGIQDFPPPQTTTAEPTTSPIAQAAPSS